jgi:hypothetical protein
MEVACRQLGFTGGEWYFWHLHLNDTVQILYEDPGKTHNLMTKACTDSKYQYGSWVIFLVIAIAVEQN